MPLGSREVLKALNDAGFVLVGQKAAMFNSSIRIAPGALLSPIQGANCLWARL